MELVSGYADEQYHRAMAGLEVPDECSTDDVASLDPQCVSAVADPATTPGANL